jgi:hypothetical protein
VHADEHESEAVILQRASRRVERADELELIASENGCDAAVALRRVRDENSPGQGVGA